MNTERAITYSLLAHIRNNSTLIEGPVDIFVPLVKRAISLMNKEGIYSGKSIVEIKNYSDKIYLIDFPIPVLKTILNKIASDVNVNDEKRFVLYQDYAFTINNYDFTEFDEVISKNKDDINSLEHLFQEFCFSSEISIDNNATIFEFIDKNKITLSKYLSNHKTSDKDYSAEALFINYFKKIPTIYDLIKKIYLGSILSGFIEYKTENIKTNIELLFDTNFIIGILDLNTPESTHTCRKLVEIANTQGYKLTILKDTIEETKRLLNAKIDNFDTVFLQKKVYPEDIYNACERRKLTRTDLERLIDNIDLEINRYNINIVLDTSKYQNEARFSNEYQALKKCRNNDAAALHDATAIYYVRKKRMKRIKEFENVNCWFVNNSFSREKQIDENEDSKIKNGYQLEIIKADDLLNILWLSNPQINKSVSIDDIVDIGLTSLISLTLSESLPKSSIIKELDDNIQKYAKEKLKDIDIVRLATRITNKQVKNLESLNKLAKTDVEEFIKRIETESNKQQEIEEERYKRFDKLYTDLEDKGKNLYKLQSELEQKYKDYDSILEELKIKNQEKDKEIGKLADEINKQKSKRLIDENNRRSEKREEFFKEKIYKWRKNSWVWFSVFLLITVLSFLYFFSVSKWDISVVSKNIKDCNGNIILSAIIFFVFNLFNVFIIKALFNKYHNYSNIEAYKKNIKMPEELKDLIEI